MKRGFKTFLKEEDGMGVVEIILIIVVLVSLVAIFKKEITSVVNTILKKISSQAKVAMISFLRLCLQRL